MHEKTDSAAAPPRSLPASVSFPLWAVLMSGAFGFGLALFLQLKGARPELFPPLLEPGESSRQGALLLSAIFALVVAASATLGARLAGPFGALGAGLFLTLCWPAILFVPLSPPAAGLALLLLIVTLLFLRGGAASTVGWVGLFLVVGMWIVPALRESFLGLWVVPEGLSWERLVFWRDHSSLARPLPLLGPPVLFALGLSALLVLRGRRDGLVVVALLLVSLLSIFLSSTAWALLLYVLALLAALSGVWVDAVWRAWRTSRRRALTALVLPALVLLVLGIRFSQVDATRLSDTELDLRMERVTQLRQIYHAEEIRPDLEWMRENFPEDRRTQLAGAEILLARREFREAARVFKNLRRADPEWRASLMGAAWADFFNGTYPTSIKYFEMILEEDPDNARALVGLGACAIYESKDYQEAERLMMKGLAIDEEISEAHHNMALMLIKSRAMYDSEENMGRLRHHAQRCMELDPTNDDMRRFARRSGWYDLIPEDESPKSPPR